VKVSSRQSEYTIKKKKKNFESPKSWIIHLTSYLSGDRRLHRRVYRRRSLRPCMSHKTYDTTKRVWGNARTLIFFFHHYFVQRTTCTACPPSTTLRISFPYRRRRRRIPFLHGPCARHGVIVYTIIHYTYRRIYHGRVHAAGAGRRRRRRRGRRRQGLRKQLHGLFARYVSYFERVAYFYCVTTMYIMYLHIRALYTRLVNFVYHFFFFPPTCDESPTTARAYGIRTYVRTYVHGTYSEVDHYYRNLTPMERKKKKENVCI